MTHSIDQLPTIFTINDVKEIKVAVTAVDMRDEIVGALVANAESSVIFCTYNYPGDPERTLFCLFPENQRGGVCHGGLTEWFDATNLDELEDRWLENHG
jgi:hypothetical protein